jgi:hypothetical protein
VKTDWYKGPLTKAHVASLRRKLAIARGALEEVAAFRRDGASISYSDPDQVACPTEKYLRSVIRRTADK